MDWETMSTCHCEYASLAQTVDHYKFLDSRRMTSVRDRWSKDHTDALQMSFFNGVGVETTENDWGTSVPFSPRSAEALRRIALHPRRMPEQVLHPNTHPAAGAEAP